MSDLLGDIRFALRILRRSPVFAFTVLLLLGIGIGANTLIFSVMDVLLLRPLPIEDPELLVRLVEVHPSGHVSWDLPPVLQEQIAVNSSSLTGALCQGDIDVAFEEGGATERIRIHAVSGNFFSTLGFRPHLGRVLTPEDDNIAAQSAVLSYDFWQQRFAGSSSIIGQTIRLNGRAFTVVGVMPKGANGLTIDTAPTVRVPLTAGKLLVRKPGMDPSDPHFLQVQIFARLRPGMTREGAEAELEPLLRRTYEDTIIRSFPEQSKGPRKEVFASVFRLEPAGNGISVLRTQFSHGVMLLMVCVGLLLLMACANVGCLLLARSSARSHEIGLRLVLGAKPWRVGRQLLTESLVLALPGGALGVLLTYAAKPLLLASLPPIRDRAAVVQPLALRVDIDLRVLGFALVATLLTAMLFGLSPALRGVRHDLSSSLRGTRTSTVRLPGRNVLVAVQVAVCVLLLAGASVLVKTFARLRSMDAGFDRDHVVTFTADPGLKGYTPERSQLLSRQLLEKTRTLPGVVAAANAWRAVMRGTGIISTFGVAGAPIASRDLLKTSLNSVTPGYFETMGMHIIAGGDFTWSDDNTGHPREMIVNQAFVRRFFPGEDPVGRLFGGRGDDGLATPDNQIIGVVNDAKYRSLREEIPATVYAPVVKGFDSSFILHVRTHGDPASVTLSVREALRSLDSELPFIEVRALEEEVETSLWQERLLARLSILFGGFAALLAGIGLYGALDFAVKARTREIGVRVALGADPLRVVRLLSNEVLLVVVIGAVSGMGIYLAASPWIRHVLYGVSPSDPGAIGSALLFVAVIALLASTPPTWRAIRIDPASALREQ